MKLLLALVIACGIGVAGCGVTTSGVTSSEPVYTPALIKQVGVGSVALANSAPAIRAQAKATGVLQDRSLQQAETYLFEGRLDKLRLADLSRMASSNHNAAAHFDDNLRKVDRVAASLSGAVVNASAYQRLPDGSKTFLADWNQELRTEAAGLTHGRNALVGARPFFGEMQSLLRAAYNTAQLRSTVQFDKVRRRFIADVRSRFPDVDGVVAADHRRADAAERTLISLVNNNREAQAIFEKVNQEYPHGWLAQEFR